MDWNSIITTFLASCIPAIVSYLVVSNQTKSKIEEIEKNNQNELDKMKLEYDLKLKEKESDSQNQFVNKFVDGSLDLDSLTKNMEKLSGLQKASERLSKSNFRK